MLRRHASRALIAATLMSTATSLAASPVEAPFLAENDAAHAGFAEGHTRRGA